MSMERPLYRTVARLLSISCVVFTDIMANLTDLRAWKHHEVPQIRLQVPYGHMLLPLEERS